MMTEIELIQAAQGAAEQAMAGVQWQLSMITGYLLIAYFIGTKLSTLQIAFVNLVFLLMHTNAVVSVVMGILRESYYTQQVLKISPETPNIGSSGDGAVVCVVGSLIITAGCLSYMWSVRHPKTA
jgi:hypothetical protein